MQKTSINPEVLQAVLDSAPNAAQTGQSQFFTPPEFGRALAVALPRHRATIVDLNCGAADLLHAAANKTTVHLLGCDIDPCRSSGFKLKTENLKLARIAHDLTLLYPQLAEVQFTADLFVLNPPWSLQWHLDRLAPLGRSALPAVRAAYKNATRNTQQIDSTVATLMIALDLCSTYGEGLLIANNATLERLIFAPDAPFSALAAHVWYRLVIPGNPMTGDATANWQTDEPFNTGVIFFARGHTNGPRPVQTLETSNLELQTSLADIRHWRQGSQVYDHLATASAIKWSAVKEHVALLETENLKLKPRFHLWLSGGAICVNLSRFEEFSIKLNKSEAARLHALKGRTPMELVLQRNERQELLHVARDAGWKVHPDLLAAVDKAIHDYHAARAPIYPLPKIKRLGYLDEEDNIVCEQDLRLGSSVVFRKGQSYPIRTKTVDVSRECEKPNSRTGEPEKHEYSGQELAIFIKDGDTDDSVEYAFMSEHLRADGTTLKLLKENNDSSDVIDFTLVQLCDHFIIPEVPDVATLHPEAYAKNIAALEELERLCGIKLKPFQKQDLARAALHDGLIMGWDTGLGKTWTLFLFPLLKLGFEQLTHSSQSQLETETLKLKTIRPKGPVLVIAPGDLHAQISKEALDCFKITVTPLDSQDAFHRLNSQGGASVPASLSPTPHSAFRNPHSHVSADGRPIIPAGFYITSYTQLTTNGVQDMPDPDKWQPRALLDSLGLKLFGSAVPLETSNFKLQTSGWPVSAEAFFSLRNQKNLWNDHYDLFKLDYTRAIHADLQRALDRETERANQMPDEASRSNRLKALAAAFAILENLVPTQHATRITQFTDLSTRQQDWVIREFCRRRLIDYAENNGITRIYPVGPIPDGYNPSLPETDTRPQWKIKCVYSPSLSDLCYNAFDAVSIDEGVRLKSTDSLVGMGVRAMEPQFRCLATAAPIKNRLPDIFWLAWWATGGRREAHARFPYRDAAAELSKFTHTFLITDHITTYDENGKARKPRAKVTAEVCNIHRLWKLLGPIVLRRRKQDCGEDIVPRIKKIIRCRMGTEQRRVYQYHLQATYLDRNDDPAIGAQLQALRQAAVAPATPNLLEQFGQPTEPCPVCAVKSGRDVLPRVPDFEHHPHSLIPQNEKGMVNLAPFEPPTASFSEHATRNTQPPRCPKCSGLGTLRLPARASTNYIPKTAAVLTIIEEILRRKEQVLVAAAFNEPNYCIAELLTEAGVRHVIMDGQTPPAKRGKLAAHFKRGRYSASPLETSNLKLETSLPLPVALCGVESMAEGHSFDKCNNAILFCYSWAMDKIKQILDRIHRLNSKKTINVYVIFCDGTIDARLESLTDEKTDSSDLCLDGALMGERGEEVNFAELLQLAQTEFRDGAGAATVDETTILAEWPSLRSALAAAQRAWDDGLTGRAALPRVPEIARSIHPIIPMPPIRKLRLLDALVHEPVPFVLPLKTENLKPIQPDSALRTPPSALPASWRDRLRDRATRLRQLQPA